MWVSRLPSELYVGDRVRAVTTPRDADSEVVGEIDRINSGGFYVRPNGSKISRYLANVLRTYYRWEPDVSAPASDETIEVTVDGHTFQLGDDQHLRVWLEEGRVHVEMVLP